MIKQSVIWISATGLAIALPIVAIASPTEDMQRFQQYFLKIFPKIPKEQFVNGVYAIDPIGRQNWEAIEEFPPYEPFVDQGKTLWETPFANGKSYKDCFPDGPAQRKNYPHWDSKRGMVITMELAINECREANGEKPFGYLKGPIAILSAYMAFVSRGQIMNVQIPENDARALAAYEKGKNIWLKRSGQFDLACAHCHAKNAGRQLRSDILSPALGHVTSWPVYRSKWGELGTLHHRFEGCNEQLRAKPFVPQGEEYRNLEYFLSIMNNGLPYNGPSSRK